MAHLTDIHDFWTVVVEPDVREYLDDPADLRKAMHAAVSLYQMKDWGAESGLWQKSNAPFFEHCPEFRFVRDVCNALKHLKLDHTRSTGMAGSQDVQQRGVFDSGIFDSGIFDTARVVVDAGVDGVHDFQQVVEAVEAMWKEVLAALQSELHSR